MKILFVSQYFYPETFKGNEIVFDLVKRGHEVTVLTAKPNYPGGKFHEGYSFFGRSEETIRGAKIVRTLIYPRKNGSSIHLILNYISFVFFSYFTFLYRVRDKFDLIFVQQLSPVTMAFPGLWAKKKHNTPLLLWVLDLWPESVIAASGFKNKRIIGFLERLVRNIYNKSDLVLVSSKYFKNSILEKLDDKAKEIVYFPNWAEDVYRNEIDSSVNIPDLPVGFNIMFAGNVGESQDFETILKAAQLSVHKKINWIIVGDGRKIDWVKNEVKNSEMKNVFLLGRHELGAMPLFFHKADVMLVTLKDEPVFALTVPAKIQAYMASGKIILGALNGEGNKLINESGCGFSVAAGDFSSLSDKAIELYEMETQKKHQMEHNSKTYYDNNFSKEMLFDKLDLIIKEYTTK